MAGKRWNKQKSPRCETFRTWGFCPYRCCSTRDLFPDTGCRYVYGGDSAHIPDLTYEQFPDCHRRFCHPSNSYIFLDGKVDLEQGLSILDEEYLNTYDREDRVPAVPEADRGLRGGIGRGIPTVY